MMAWKPGYSSTQPPTIYSREMSVAPPSPDSRRSPPVTCARACPRRMGALAGGWHVRFLRVRRFTPCARFLCVLASPQPVLAAHGRPTRRQLAARHAAERWCARAPRPVCAAWRAGVYFFSFQLPAREPPPVARRGQLVSWRAGMWPSLDCTTRTALLGASASPRVGACR